MALLSCDLRFSHGFELLHGRYQVWGFRWYHLHFALKILSCELRRCVKWALFLMW